MYLFGDEVLKLGMKTYFDRFAFKNAQMSDFIECLRYA